MKKLFIPIFVMIVFLALLTPVNAFGTVEAPGGTIASPEEFVAALGGEEAAYCDGNTIILKSDILMNGTLVITSGTYTISGTGCYITRNFKDSPVIMLQDATLILGSEKGSDDHPSLTLDGNGGVFNSAGAMIYIKNGGVLDIYVGTLFINNRNQSDGSAVCSTRGGTVNIYGGVFKDNISSANGGAISAVESDLTIESVLMTGNTAQKGGAIYAVGSETVLLSGELKENFAEYGGAIYAGGTFVYGNAATESNRATYGGGLYIDEHGEFNMAGGYFASNDAQLGGGIYNKGVLNFIGGTSAANTSANGAGLLNEGNVEQSGGEITSNTASSLGGGVVNNGTYKMTGGSVSSNKSEDEVGGIVNSGIFYMSDGSISSNKAENGVGVGMRNSGELTIADHAFISFNNDVSLDKDVIVAIEGELTANSPVATFTPAIYKNGIVILTGSESDLETAYLNGKLAVSNDESGKAWSYTAKGTIQRSGSTAAVILIIAVSAVLLGGITFWICKRLNPLKGKKSPDTKDHLN